MIQRLLILSTLLILTSCGIHPITQKTMKLKNSFSEEMIKQLRLGMQEAEVLQLFGEPSRKYERIYEINGVRRAFTIVRYKISTDRNFKFVERWKRNTFIFENSYDKHGLVFWEILDAAGDS